MQSGKTTIRHATLIEYLPPRSTGRASVADASANVVVRLAADSPVGPVTGVGECQLRKATGDTPARSWQFLTEAIEHLQSTRLDVASRSTAVEQVWRITTELRDRAAASKPFGKRAPLRGSVFGLETALLDLVAKSLELSVAELLEARHSEVAVTPTSLSLAMTTADLVDRYRRRRSSSVVRLRLTGEVASDLRALRVLASEQQRAGAWWLEAGAGLSAEEAEDLVAALADGMRARFPPLVIVEQPVGASRHAELSELQRVADKLTGRGGQNSYDLRIMADEALATADDLTTLTENGGCRALNIKPARVGGLLPALSLVREAVQSRPDTMVALSDMADTSDISARALHHLAAALPRLDYLTRDPSNNLVELTDPPPRLPSGRRKFRSPTGAGLGGLLRLEPVIPLSRRYRRHPGSLGPMLGSRYGKAYPEEDATRFLSKPAMRSHLVEREALAHGLSTTRFNPTAFVAYHEQATPLIFGASARSPVSSATSFVIADKHKGAAHALLERAGVPVPAGCVFSPDDLQGATAYARRIGYPVVSKPVGGTGGAAVTTGISSDADLARGFQAVRASPRYSKEDVLVQKHVPGEVYRIMVQADTVTAALMRTPPSVTGDGERTIADLIIEKNAYRLANPRLRKGPIDQHRSAEHLAAQGLGLDTVPTSGKRIVLAKTPYLNDGGDSIDVLDELHPSIAEACIRAVKAVLGLHFCGVDILLENHRTDVSQQAAGICELNSCPELVTPQFPLFGEPRPVARNLLRFAADLHGVQLFTEPAERLGVRLSVEGRVTSVGYVTWFARLARELQLSGWVSPSDGGRVEALIAGPTIPVSVIASLAVSGPRDARPILVKTRHADAGAAEGFTVRRRVPQSTGGDHA